MTRDVVLVFFTYAASFCILRRKELEKHETNRLYFDYAMINKSDNAPPAVLGAITPMQ